jgi:hypothetical protein
MKNNSPFVRPFVIGALVIMLTSSITAMTASSFVQDDDVAPAPPSIGADILLTYFGPAL